MTRQDRKTHRSKMMRGRLGLAAGLAVSSMMLLGSAGGCQSDAQTGGLAGAGAGALAGQAIGNDTESTLIGAGVGGALGYIIGNESDKQKARDQHHHDW